MTDDETTQSTAPAPPASADPLAPASAAPALVVTPARRLDDIPPGWELETQRLRRVKPAADVPPASPIRPTAPVMSATAGSTIGPLIGYVASSLGHPIPPDVLVALTVLTTFLAGWLHPAGRGTTT